MGIFTYLSIYLLWVDITPTPPLKLGVLNTPSKLRLRRFLFSSGTVDEANINRSPTSYEANPEEEKAKYTGQGMKYCILQI